MEELFPGELETLRADNVRLRRLLELSEWQARAAELIFVDSSQLSAL